MPRIAIFLVVGAALTALASARPQRTTTPQTEDQEDLGHRQAHREQTRRAVRENCLMCHSDELLKTQRLTPQQWKAEVEKMIGWGSPLPVEWQQPVIEFLASEYPSNAPAPLLDRQPLARLIGSDASAVLSSPVMGDSTRGAKLYVQNCANCHGADGQGAELGTNLVEKPVLVKVEDYSEVVRKGLRRMPAFSAALTTQGEIDILAWLRGQRYRPARSAAR